MTETLSVRIAAAFTARQTPPNARAALRLACILALALAGCARQTPAPPITLPNDAYVWQRLWNEPVRAALAESAPRIRAWRVLAAEAGARKTLDVIKLDTIRLDTIKVDREALRRTAHPVIAVIRIDARRGAALDTELAGDASALASDWQHSTLPLQGLEIDYDCATDRLPQYRAFLHLLHARLPRGIALSITALPSWIGSPELPGLLAEVDETVLQVHSVLSPGRGLFDRAMAEKWVRAWSALSPVPFRLALPTYWSRVTWNEEGRVVAIESETSRYGNDPDAQELVVTPAEVSALVAQLRLAPPRHLAGIAWFRLPTSLDRRAWSPHTWHAIMKGEPLPVIAPVLRLKPDPGGATDVYLLNPGNVDGPLPQQVSISAQDCEFADAAAPYDSHPGSGGVVFRRKGNGLLRAGRETRIGWIRCSGKTVSSHVSY